MKSTCLRKALVFALSFAILLASAGCGSTKTSGEATGDGSAEAAPQKVVIAFSSTGKPMEFVNDAGEADGYEVQVLKAIDELLPQYEFVFEPTTDDSDLLIGIETGKYDLGVKGAWVTEERKQKFIFPKNPVGASSIGLLYRNADASKYTDLEGFAAAGGKLVPIAPQNAQYAVIEDFNAKHPDTPIALTASETFSVADAYRWVMEGRYDGYFDTKTGYLKNIANEDSPYHEYNDAVSYAVYRSLPTWPLFNRNNQAIADAYDEAFAQVLASGKVNELMLEYLGENTFNYIIEDEYQYLKPTE